MRSYGVVKNKAQEFADERKRPVYIAKAIKSNHHRIIFNESELTPRHRIVEVVYPKDSEQ